MGVFEMVVAIVAVSCCAGVINNWLKTRTKIGGDELERRLDERLSNVTRLEKRIQVLEKIVTDRNYDLKRELHNLEKSEGS